MKKKWQTFNHGQIQIGQIEQYLKFRQNILCHNQFFWGSDKYAQAIQVKIRSRQQKIKDRGKKLVLGWDLKFGQKNYDHTKLFTGRTTSGNWVEHIASHAKSKVIFKTFVHDIPQFFTHHQRGKNIIAFLGSHSIGKPICQKAMTDTWEKTFSQFCIYLSVETIISLDRARKRRRYKKLYPKGENVKSK